MNIHFWFLGGLTAVQDQSVGLMDRHLLSTNVVHFPENVQQMASVSHETKASVFCVFLAKLLRLPQLFILFIPLQCVSGRTRLLL